MAYAARNDDVVVVIVPVVWLLMHHRRPRPPSVKVKIHVNDGKSRIKVELDFISTFFPF
jgi:hypothetical protein